MSNAQDDGGWGASAGALSMSAKWSHLPGLSANWHFYKCTCGSMQLFCGRILPLSSKSTVFTIIRIIVCEHVTRLMSCLVACMHGEAWSGMYLFTALVQVGKSSTGGLQVACS